MVDLNIDKYVESYEVSLASIDVQNNLRSLPNELSIGLKCGILEKRFSKEVQVPIAIDLVGRETNNENLLFKVSLVYNNYLKVNNIEEFEEKMNRDDFKKKFDDYAYFLVQPVLNSTVQDIMAKVGINSINIPKALGKDGTNNNI